MKYVPGTKNGHCDALSRLPLPDAPSEVPQPGDVVHLLSEVETKLVRVRDVCAWTRRDELLSAVLRYTQQGWPDAVRDEVKPFFRKKDKLSVDHGCLLWGCRLVIPQEGRSAVVNLLHNGHPGVVAMKSLDRSLVWWPGVDQEIERRVQKCDACQRNRASGPSVPDSAWTPPSGPWQRIHLDFAGPVEGKTLLVVVDDFSKYPEVFTCTSVSTHVVIDQLRTAFASHGLPEVIVTDNATCFNSAEISTFLSVNGVKQRFSPPRHPSSNGLAKSMVKNTKTGLKKQRAAPLHVKSTRWLFSYRNTPHSTTGKSPAELIFRRRPRTHLDFNWASPASGKCVVPASRRFEAGDPVYLANIPESSSVWSPAEVVRSGGLLIHLRLPDRREFVRHTDHVRGRSAVSDNTPEHGEMFPPQQTRVDDTAVQEAPIDQNQETREE